MACFYLALLLGTAFATPDKAGELIGLSVAQPDLVHSD